MNYRVFILMILSALLLSACNLGTSAPQQPDLATAAAQTVEAVLTSTVPLATPTLENAPGVAIDGTTAEPAECEESTNILSWTRNQVNYDKAEVDKRLEAGTGFTMSWQIENNGTCTWTDEYNFAYRDGTRLSQQDRQPVMPKGYTVRPGEVLTINVQMTAPAIPGNYTTTLSLVDAQGNFILNVGVLTNVGSTSTGELAAPGDLKYFYDCTSGIVSITLSWVDKAEGEDGYRIYRDGVQIGEVAANTTTYQDIAPAPGSYQYIVTAYNLTSESPTKVVAETSNCK